MSCSTTYPISITRGDTFSWLLKFSVGGTAYNITGFDFFFTAKLRKGDLDIDAVITQDWNASVDIPNAVLGLTLFNLSSVQTDISPGDYYYDLKFRSPSGETKTFISGILSIKESITDR